jgi:hypothetical protein
MIGAKRPADFLPAGRSASADFQHRLSRNGAPLHAADHRDQVMNFLRVLRLGRTVPAIIAILVDFGARFFSIDALAFRGWEALVRYRAPCGPFRANAKYYNPASYGDLSVLEIFPVPDLPPRNIYRCAWLPAQFPLGEPNQDYKVILLGDSMSVGSSVNDEETLSHGCKLSWVSGSTTVELRDK